MGMYPVNDYHKYISQATLADTTFEQAYLARYRRDNPNLTIGMMETHFYVLQCGVAAEDPQRYIDHCDFVHGMYATDLPLE